ncbi:hypothetical protein ACFOGJ_15930 [Marinibaculum pumilum]|uniref:Uncharacterized protein n=1 Tax=Marinibaculum pumilum TaxID=1766165 RepID=A0ABV7L2M1_9PROT
MGWERLNRDRLAKVLALTGSDRDGEALAALRKANGMLSTVGLNFGDLARRLDEPSSYSPHASDDRAAPEPPPERPSGKGEAGARAEIRVLLHQISELHGRLARAEAESAFQQAEAQHWHDLTIEAARYVCLLEEELFAVRRALEAADRTAEAEPARPGAVLAPAGHHVADPAEREKSAASAGGALGERIAQFVAWQKTLSRA